MSSCGDCGLWEAVESNYGYCTLSERAKEIWDSADRPSCVLLDTNNIVEAMLPEVVQ